MTTPTRRTGAPGRRTLTSRGAGAQKWRTHGSRRVWPAQSRRTGETHEQAVKRLLDSRVEQGFERKCADPVVLATIASLLPGSEPPASR